MSKLKVNELDTESGTTITVAAGKTIAGTDIIDTAQLATDSVQGDVIKDLTVGTDKIGTAAVVLATKVETGTHGDIIFYNSSAKANRMAAGTSGYFLKTQGAGGDPIWASLTEYNDAAVLNDIATLALQQSTQNNQSAYNLANAFVDQYEDSTGVDTLSTVVRDTTGEYMWAATDGYANFVNDVNTMFLAHMDGANNGTTFTDSSSNAHAITAMANAKTVTGEKRVGTASLYQAAAGDYIYGAGHTDFHNTDNFTMEGWVNSTNTAHCAIMDFRNGSNTANFYIDFQFGGSSNQIASIFAGQTRQFNCAGMADGNWHHWAFVRDYNNPGTNTWYFYFDGVSLAPVSGGMSYHMTNNIDTGSADLTIGTNYAHSAGANFLGYQDEFRLSNTVRYPAGTTFLPNQDTIAAASGNYTSTTETAAATVSKMGIVVLYKNESGTATLSTDLVAEVSANGGTNWTAAPLTAGGTFSTGILIAKSNDITITNTGTAPKFRISFANQSAGVKETRVYGASLQY